MFFKPGDIVNIYAVGSENKDAICIAEVLDFSPGHLGIMPLKVLDTSYTYRVGVKSFASFGPNNDGVKINITEQFRKQKRHAQQSKNK